MCGDELEASTESGDDEFCEYCLVEARDTLVFGVPDALCKHHPERCREPFLLLPRWCIVLVALKPLLWMVSSVEPTVACEHEVVTERPGNRLDVVASEFVS
jgi:hypothetical protein